MSGLFSRKKRETTKNSPVQTPKGSKADARTEQPPISVSVPRRQVAATRAAVPQEPPGDIFAGLHVNVPTTSQPSDDSSSQVADPPRTSSFSFLSGDSGASQIVVESTPSESTSGFSFISGKSSEPEQADDISQSSGGFNASTADRSLASKQVAADSSKSSFGFITNTASTEESSSNITPSPLLPNESSAAHDHKAAESSDASKRESRGSGSELKGSLEQAGSIEVEQPDSSTARMVSTTSDKLPVDSSRTSSLTNPRKLSGDSSPKVPTARAASTGSSPKLSSAAQKLPAGAGAPGGGGAKKKKKRMAVRPGHARPDESFGEEVVDDEAVAMQQHITGNDLTAHEDKVKLVQKDESNIPLVPGNKEVKLKSESDNVSTASSLESVRVRDKSELAVGLSAGGDKSCTDHGNSDASSTPPSAKKVTAENTVSDKSSSGDVDAEKVGDKSDEVTDVDKETADNVLSVSHEQSNAAAKNVPVDISRNESEGNTAGKETEEDLRSLVKTVNGGGVFDIQFTIEERLSLRLQSEDSQLADIRLDLNRLEGKLLQWLASQLQHQRERLERRREVDLIRQQETEAIGSENYELADELSAKLRDAEEVLAEDIQQLPLSEQVSAIHDQRHALVMAQHSVQEDTNGILRQLQREQQAELEDFQKQASVWISRQRQDLATQRDKLQRETSHIQLDWDHLARGEDRLKAELDRKTKVFTDSREELLHERTTVEEKISALEKELNSLREHRDSLTASIVAEDLRITQVQQEMGEERQRLDEQRQSIQAQQDGLDADQAKLDAATAEFEAKVQSSNHQEEEHQLLLKAISSRSQGHQQSVEQYNADQQQIKEYLAEKRPELSRQDSLAQLKVLVDEHALCMKNLASKLLSQKTELQAHRKKIAEIDAQLPDLDVAKKLAVTGRNFKEAGRLTKEINVLVEERSGYEKQLKERQEVVASDEAELQKEEKELGNLQDNFRQKEKAHDVTIVGEVKAFASRLEKLVHGVSPQCWLSKLAGAELRYFQTVAQELYLKHGIPLTELQDLIDMNLADFDESLVQAPDASDVMEEKHGDSTGDVSAASLSAKRKEIKVKLDELEKAVQDAVSREAFDEATQLDEQITELKDELEKL